LYTQLDASTTASSSFAMLEKHGSTRSTKSNVSSRAKWNLGLFASHRITALRTRLQAENA